MVSSRLRRGGGATLWVLPLLLVLAAAAWVVADMFKATLDLQVAAALAAAVVPIVVSELRARLQKDDENAQLLKKHLRLYSKQGIPTVGSIADLAKLNVTPSREPRADAGAESDGCYVLRDRDEELGDLLDGNVFVLIIGDSKAGKTRMAAEAARRRFADRRLVYPYSAESISALLDGGLDLSGCVIWLDELEGYLQKTALNRLLDQLTGADAPDGVTVLATMSERAFGANLPRDGHKPPHWPVLKRAARLRLDRMFSPGECARAAEAYQDPHLLSALEHYGLAEYLSAGPDLLERLEHALQPDFAGLTGEGAGELVGAAAVLAVVRWSRAGLARPIPMRVLEPLIGCHLASRGLPAPGQTLLNLGLAWAKEPVYGASALLLETPEGYLAFEYVVDHADERVGAGIPDETWNAALSEARDWEEALRIGFAAHRHDRADVAVRAFESAAREANEANQSLACYNLALALERTNRLSEAQEQYLLAAAEGHPEAAVAAGRLLQAQGENAEAERNYRIAADAGNIDGSYALGILLRPQNPDEALRHLATAADGGHADAAYAAGRLLQAQGETGEAQRHFRNAADAGNIDSSYALGMLLRTDQPDEALRRLGTAADHGHADAAYTAGLMLKTQGNTTAAARFFRIAAENRESGGIQRFTPAAEIVTVAPPRLTLRGSAQRLRRCESLLARTIALEPTMAGRTDDQLRQHTNIFRRRLAAGEALDALAPEAFATFREAARRVAGLDCGDEEVIAGAAVHYGLIAQSRSRRGRLTAIAMPAYLNALAGRPVHVISVDAQAARRDADRVGPVLRFLGMDSGILLADLLEEPRRLVYGSEVLFGPLDEFAFDYLRDHQVLGAEDRVQQKLGLAIVTHADLQLLERTDETFHLPGPAQPPSPWFRAFATLTEWMQPGEHYEIDAQAFRVDPTEAGIAIVEDTLGIDNLYTVDNIPLMNHLELALKAKELYRRDVNYTVQDEKIVVLDENTGRARINSSFDDGMHQAVEAKEWLPLSPRSTVRLRIGKRGFLSRYAKLGGLATAVGFSDEVFQLCYGVNAVRIPPEAPVSRVDQDDWFFLTDEARFAALIDLIRTRHETGQPVLVDTASTEQAEQISTELTTLNVPHTILTTRNREHEAQIMGAAGRSGAVTITTNAHLSLVEVPLGGNAAGPADREAVAAVGGLLVVGARRHVERWRDDRLREIAGRDGQRGESRFLLALTDPVAQGAWSPGSVGDQPVSGMMLTWGIESRQRQLAAGQLDQLRRLLAFDRVEENQRRDFFALRERVLIGRDINALAYGYLRDALRRLVAEHKVRSSADWAALDASVTRLCGIRLDQSALPPGPGDPAAGDDSANTATGRGWDAQAVLTTVQAVGDRAWDARSRQLGAVVWAALQRRVLLLVLDRSWPDHLAALGELRRSAPLAALRNADPLVEYDREAAVVFQELHAAVKEQTVGYLMNLQVEVEPS